MIRYLIITPQCSYFIMARDLDEAAAMGSIWNTVRVVKWMAKP